MSHCAVLKLYRRLLPSLFVRTHDCILIDVLFRRDLLEFKNTVVLTVRNVYVHRAIENELSGKSMFLLLACGIEILILGGLLSRYIR